MLDKLGPILLVVYVVLVCVFFVFGNHRFINRKIKEIKTNIKICRLEKGKSYYIDFNGYFESFSFMLIGTKIEKGKVRLLYRRIVDESPQNCVNKLELYLGDIKTIEEIKLRKIEWNKKFK